MDLAARSVVRLSIPTLAVLVGCANVVTTDGGGGDGGAFVVSTGDDNPCYPDSCTAPSASGNGGSTSHAASGNGGSGSGGASSKPCGIDGGTACPDHSYCDFTFDGCGKLPSDTAACKPIPGDCDGPTSKPTCGCDGHVYGSACEAQLGGIDVDESGSCAPPPDTFQCGSIYCPLDTYCQIFNEVMSISPSCEPLPAACSNGSPSCACLGNTCGPCTQSASGNLRVICGDG